jgi:hypothetical protein
MVRSPNRVAELAPMRRTWPDWIMGLDSKGYIGEKLAPIRLLAFCATPSQNRPAGTPGIEFVAMHKVRINRFTARQYARLHETLPRGTIAGKNSLGRPEKAVTGFPPTCKT